MLQEQQSSDRLQVGGADRKKQGEREVFIIDR